MGAGTALSVMGGEARTGRIQSPDRGSGPAGVRRAEGTGAPPPGFWGARRASSPGHWSCQAGGGRARGRHPPSPVTQGAGQTHRGGRESGRPPEPSPGQRGAGALRLQTAALRGATDIMTPEGTSGRVPLTKSVEMRETCPDRMRRFASLQMYTQNLQRLRFHFIANCFFILYFFPQRPVPSRNETGC